MKVQSSSLISLLSLLAVVEVTCFTPNHVSINTLLPAQGMSSNKKSFRSNGMNVKNDILQHRMVKETSEALMEKETTKLDVDGVAVIDPDHKNDSSSGFSYGQFAKQYPFANNIGIATAKTAAADLLAQTVIAQTPIMEIDVQRSFLFMVFGAVYLGGFQYLYQVQVFKRLFDIEKFTNLSLKEKLEDKEGLKNLGLQTALDLTVLTFIYLPTFYIFKAGVFSGSTDPSVWTSTGLDNYMTNFAKDEADLLKVWFPADLVCFSVPLYLRLPVRHVVSFVWTAYLSFARGGH